MLRDRKVVAVVVAIGLVAGFFLLLYRQQQQLEQQVSEKVQTAVALATAGTAEALRGTAQAANATAFAVGVTAAVQGTATAQAGTAVAQAAAATAQAGTATAQARSTATAQARASATAQAAFRERIVSRTLGTINNAAELTTAVFSIQEVAEIDQANDPILLVIPNRPTKLSYKAYIEVRAGFDLRTITKEDVEVTGDTVTIHLPPPKILVESIDHSRSQVYEEDVPWFGKLRAATVENVQRFVLKDALAEACGKQILDQANQNARTAFENLLFAFDFSDVTVILQPAGGCD
jgi:hypothetical protein